MGQAPLGEAAGQDRRVEPISDAYLAVFDPVPDRMLSVRDLSRDAADLYEVAWSREDRSWVLPIRHAEP